MQQLVRQLITTCISWSRRLFIPIAVGFLIFSAYSSADRLKPLFASLSVSGLIVAWACWCTAQCVGPVTTMVLARMFGLQICYRELAFISIVRLPAKYLPGGIWQSVARFAAYTQLEVKKADSFTILIIEHLLALSVSAGVGAALMLLSDLQSLRRIALWVLAAATVVLAIAAWLALKRSGSKAGRLAEVLMLIGATALFWLFASASFCAYWAAVFGLSSSDTVQIAACYLLSWAAGFVAPFAPQGLGVFEWVASHLLPQHQSMGVTVAVVAGFRLVTVIADFSVWAATIIYARRGTRDA